MPKFPHSGYSANQSSGVFVKAQGSASPMLDVDIPAPAEIVHPFQVSVQRNGATYKAIVRAGTVNNIVPDYDGQPIDGTRCEITMDVNEINRIYIKASSATPPVFLPDTLEVIRSFSVLTDTDTYGYLQIASVTFNQNSVQIHQFVYASQVLVRAKPGTADALWSWSSR